MKSKSPFCFCGQESDPIISNPFPNLRPEISKSVKDAGFFRNYYEICCGRAELHLHGRLVTHLLGRRLQDSDIPALLIFLRNNQIATSVDLSYNNITDAGFKNLLDYSTLHKNLYELRVQNNGITENGMNYLLEIGERVKIKSLRLSGNKIGVEGAKKLGLFLLKNSYILNLDAADLDQTASSLQFFAAVLNTHQMPHNSTLKFLNISRPNPGCMHYFDTKHFADAIGRVLKCNAHLTELRLQKHGFDCHDLDAMLLNAKENRTLLLLDLGSNNIGDHGIEVISAWLTRRPALKTLVLRRNIITEHGARDLSRSLPFSKITYLDVSHNRITDEGITEILNSIKKVPLLRSLKIFGNQIGSSTIKIIHRMLISKVLVQERLDVRPYTLDREWRVAKYSGDSSRNRCYDFPLSRVQIRRLLINRKYHKHVYLKSISGTVEKTSDTDSWEADYSERDVCGGGSADSICGIYECNRSVCKLGASGSSMSSEDSRRDFHADLCAEMVAPVLDRVNSRTREMILRWINMDESVLEQDLIATAGEGKERSTTEESSSSNEAPCHCSWSSLSFAKILKYLEGMPVDVLLVTEPEESASSGNASGKSAGSSASLLQYCTNIL